tara:strand:+ start:80 stop:706 length:627 start_codon:yes stop_codon:yes gene_type:complete
VYKEKEYIMYKTHNKRINTYALKSPENMANVVLMVSQSIQQVWAGVGKQMQDIEANGLDSVFLKNQTKRKLFIELHERKRELWLALHDYRKGRIDLPDLLCLFQSIHGLGFVKAGFVLQLCTGEVGCLDIHNLRMYGVKATDFLVSATATTATKRRKAELYIATCEKLGGSASLWDVWCEALASNKRCGHLYTSKHHVSRLHCDFVGA